MDILEIAFRLLLAFALGATLGLEREINEKKSLKPGKEPTAILGLRSFSLMTVFGAVTGFIYLQFAALALVIASAFFIMLLIFYYLDSATTKDHGLTSEITALFSFIIGILLATGLFPLQITIAVTTLVLLLLSQKDKIKGAIDDIRRFELNAFIIYAILALVIMPFLPNSSFSLSDFKGLNDLLKNAGIRVRDIINIDLFNPFKTWLVLVLITGVDLAGYILSRIIGNKKGWLITSIIGGFVSSTSTTQALAQQSKKSAQINHLVAAAILANLVSFFQIAAIIGAVNAGFLIHLLPVLGTIILSSALIFIFFIKSKNPFKKISKENAIDGKVKIIDLSGAIKFASLYLAVSIISKIAISLFGNTGLLLTTGIGSVIGLDAVMINTSQLAGNSINQNTASIAFILANAVNLTAKSIYTFVIGKRGFALKFSTGMMVIIAASVFAYFLF